MTGMKTFHVYIKGDEGEKHKGHFCEKCAKEAIARTKYTDKTGAEHKGKEHWTTEQIESLTASMKFPEGTTIWDKYVAFNTMYFDLCKVLDDALIIKVAHAFYFADEDAPGGKIKRYIHAMMD